MTKNRVCANGQTMSRRTLLATIPSLGFALPVCAKEQKVNDPILPIYQVWWTAHQEWNRLCYLPGNEEWKWPESLAAEQQENAAFYQLTNMTPKSIEGIAAIAHVLWILSGPKSRTENPDFAAECTDPANKMLAALWRAASGKSGIPPTCTALV